MRLLRGTGSVRRPVSWLGRATLAALLLLTSCSSAADGDSEVAQAEISQPADAGAAAGSTDTAQATEADPAIPPTSAPITADGSSADGGVNDPNRGLRDPGAEDAINAQPPAATTAPTEGQNDQPGEPADQGADPIDQVDQVDQSNQPDQPDEAAASDPAASEPAPENPTPAPTPTPVPAIVAPDVPLIPVPTTGPVRSDELEIDAPPVVDDAATIVISDSGALACSAAESAITFLDAGDATRMTEELTRASQLAAAATEGEIRAAAPVLAAVNGDLDAGFDAIVFTLSACAVHGYQV